MAEPSAALPEEELRQFLRRRRRGTGLVHSPPLGRFLAETLDLARRLVPCDLGLLFIDDPTRPDRRREAISLVAASGRATGGLVGLRVLTKRGALGQVYRSGTTLRSFAGKSNGTLTATPDLSALETRSFIAAPIRLELAVCGVLVLANRRGRSGFDERDSQLAELLAQYASRAILNAVDVIKQNEAALWDELTGVRNVRGLEAFLDEAIRRARRSGTDLAVLFSDVDHLKVLNDRRGHRFGSEALRRAGRAIDAALGGRGVPFRFGGDEFVIVCPHASMREAAAIADDVRMRVRAQTEGPLDDGGELPPVTISVGVATLHSLRRRPRKEPKLSARLLTAADRALYRAKNAGRNRSARATVRDDVLGAPSRSRGRERRRVLHPRGAR